MKRSIKPPLKVFTFSHDLRQAGDFEWESFSYGDAAFTLVRASQLLSEVKERQEYLNMAHGTHNEVSWYALISDLETLVPDTLVAFEG